MRTFDLRKYGKNLSIQLHIASYAYWDNLAIQMIVMTEDGPEVWNTLTVNLNGPCDKNCAFIDTNNNGNEILAWIIRHGLATPTGQTRRSGYCEYPEYCFKPSILEECDPDGYAEYLLSQEDES